MGPTWRRGCAVPTHAHIGQWLAAVEEAEKQEGGGQRAGGVAHAHVAGLAHACMRMSMRPRELTMCAHAHGVADVVPQQHWYRTA